jgi:hypothetical protein
MESSTDESDSRTAAFSRKRKQPTCFNFGQYAPEVPDKRLKLDPEYDGRRSSNQSGETSASIFSARSKDSSATSEEHEVEDLDPERASRFGWTVLDNNEARVDPFTDSYRPQPTSACDVFDRPAMQTTGAKADAIFAKLQQKKGLSIEDHQVMARWLETNDKGLKTDVIQHSGLKARIIVLMRASNLDEVPGVAKVLGVISQGGDYCTKGRLFLKERFYIIRNSPALSGTGVLGPDGTRKESNSALPGASTHTKKPEWGHSGLIKLDDIQNHSLKTKMQDPSKVNRKETVEETLRAMVVNREPSFKQAEKYLTLFYQARNVTAARLCILQGAAEQDLPVAEMEKAMANPKGFLRPFISTDLPSLTTVSTAVAECMDKSSNTSFATALFLHARSGTASGVSAKRCLENFIKINFVGGDQDSPIHSRIGLKDLLSSTVYSDKSGSTNDTGLDDAGHKLTSMGAAALTLDELESLLQKPGNDPKEKLAGKKAKTRRHIDDFWKRPNSFNCLVAWQLLALIKAGNALPNARKNLDRFVEALNGLAVGDMEPQDNHVQALQNSTNHVLETQNDTEMQESDTFQSLSIRKPLKPLLHYEDEPVLLQQAGDTVAYDYGNVVRKAAGGASTESGLSSEEPAAGTDTNADDGMRSLADIEQMLHEPRIFSRPMRITDLIADDASAHMVRGMCNELGMRLEDALLYLATSAGHAHTAWMSLNQYVNRCHPQARPHTPFDHVEAAVEAAPQEGSSTDLAQDEDSHSTESPDQHEAMQQPHIDPIDSESLQRRYFHTTYSNAPVRCMSCGKDGHTEDTCPSRTCSHCGAIDQHFCGACPINHKCGRCRQRGHTTASCASLFSSLMRGSSSQCDICGRPDHVEEECSNLWRSSIDGDAPIIQMPQQAMRVSCYNCGASGHFAHWGDDCPNFTAYDRSVESLNPTWSKKYADEYLQKTALPEQRPHAEYGSVPSYRLAMLGDM